jgi:glycosyltransferase involved in cell wall biosynthesis
MTADTKGITFAVVCYNASRTISNALLLIEAVIKNSNETVEVLIVDNNSTDNTRDVVKEFYAARHVDYPFRVLTEPRQGALYARIKAAKEAKSEWLCYVDSDNYITNNWIEEFYKIIATNTDIDCIGTGAYLPKGTSVPHWFDGVKGWFAIGDQLPVEGPVMGTVPAFWTAGSLFRTERLKSVLTGSVIPVLSGRTAEKAYGGEDHEICYLMALTGSTFYYSKKLQFEHDIAEDRITLKSMYLTVFRSAQAKPVLAKYKYAITKDITEHYVYRLFISIYLLAFNLLKYMVKGWCSPLRKYHPYLICAVRAAGYCVGCIKTGRQRRKAVRNIKVLQDG